MRCECHVLTDIHVVIINFMGKTSFVPVSFIRIKISVKLVNDHSENLSNIYDSNSNKQNQALYYMIQIMSKT